jgi:hypothetical protein
MIGSSEGRFTSRDERKWVEKNVKYEFKKMTGKGSPTE